MFGFFLLSKHHTYGKEGVLFCDLDMDKATCFLAKRFQIPDLNDLSSVNEKDGPISRRGGIQHDGHTLPALQRGILYHVVR